jgi:hypothetical protein
LQLQAPPAMSGTDSGRTAWQEIHWRLGPREAEFDASVRLTAPSRQFAWVECDLPAEINLIDVTGPEVHAWSQSGRRLQIWLKGLVAETSFRLTGWMKSAKTGDGRPTPQEDSLLFRLPALRTLSVADQRTLIRIGTRNGWTANLSRRDNLWPTPESSIPDGSFEFLTDRPEFEAVFQLLRASSSSPSR